MARRILITDRNPRVRSLLCRELERDGYQVLSASSWNEIARAVGDGVDCVVVDMDLSLQGAHGSQGARYGQGSVALLEQLRLRAPGLPVVLHTFSSEEAAEAGSLRLVSAVVEKGSDTERLKAAVRRVLDAGSAQRGGA